MNIFEIAEKSKLSLAKLRLLDKLGVLRHDDSATEIDAIRDTLRIGNPLNAAQLVYLIERPAGILELGKYGAKAKPQLDALGNPAKEAAPPEIAAQILEASERDESAVAAIVGWCKTIIPAEPVGHAYIATRLLLGVPENVRQFDVPRVQRVMMNCRASPDFAGWWRQEKSAKSRKRTVYQKGTEKEFDI